MQDTHIQMKNSEEIVRIYLYMTHLLYYSVICPFLEVSIFFYHYLLMQKTVIFMQNKPVFQAVVSATS